MYKHQVLFTIVAASLAFQMEASAQWVQQDQFLSTNELFDIRMIDDQNGVAVGAGNLILCTTDGGTSWDGGGSFDADLRAASLVNDNIWFCNNDGAIFAEDNPGLCNGDLVAAATPSLNDMTDLQMLNSTTGFAIANGILWFSNNTWFSSLNIDASSTLNSVWFMNETEGFAGSADGRIIRYIKLEPNWIFSIVANTGEPVNDIFFFDSDVGYAAGDQGSVYRTENGGSSWNPISIPVNDRLTGVFVSTPSTAHVVGQSVYKTTDAGNNWYKMPVPSTTPQLNSIWFNDNNNGWIVGKNGFIGSTENAGGTGTLLINTGISEQEVFPFKIYPNPVADYIYLEGAPVNSFFELYSAQGVLLKKGNLEAELNLNDVSEKILLIRITTTDGLFSRIIFRL